MDWNDINKSSKFVVEQRVNEIIPLVSVLQRREIIYYCNVKQGWNLTTRQIDNYIYKARDEVKKEFLKHKETSAESIFNNRMHIYKKALKKNDLNTCRLILSDIAKMTGTDTQNIDVTSKGEQIQGFTVTIEKEEN
jgi:hypothetical protein